MELYTDAELVPYGEGHPTASAVEKREYVVPFGAKESEEIDAAGNVVNFLTVKDILAHYLTQPIFLDMKSSDRRKFNEKKLEQLEKGRTELVDEDLGLVTPFTMLEMDDESCFVSDTSRSRGLVTI